MDAPAGPLSLPPADVTRSAATCSHLMPKDFFHTEGRAEYLDEEGLELPDHQAARVEAARMLGEMLRDNAHAFWTVRALKLVVTDASGMILFALDLSGIESPAVRQLRNGRRTCCRADVA